MEEDEDIRMDFDSIDPIKKRKEIQIIMMMAKKSMKNTQIFLIQIQMKVIII